MPKITKKKRTTIMSPSPSEPEVIQFDVLRVASTDVLGQTKPLSITAPFKFSNAQGTLKRVDSVKEIRSIASESAKNFIAAMKSIRR